jgi:hypothetical protein
MELTAKRARLSGPDLWFRSFVGINYLVGWRCFLLAVSTWFSLLFSAYCSEIVPKDLLKDLGKTTRFPSAHVLFLSRKIMLSAR